MGKMFALRSGKGCEQVNVIPNLKDAIAARERGKYKTAIYILARLHSQRPFDPVVAYHYAWTLDNLGKERQAICFYEKAIAQGLKGAALKDCYVGLGSSLRCLGQYRKSAKVLQKAARLFPRYHPIGGFLALTYFEDKRQKKAFQLLMRLFLGRCAHRETAPYKKSLSYYSNRL